MTAPDTRDSVERIVAEMRGFHVYLHQRVELVEVAIREWAYRLSALPHPDALPDGTFSRSTIKRREALQQAGGEDAKDAARWRKLTKLDVGDYIEITSMNNPDELGAAIDAIVQAGK